MLGPPPPAHVARANQEVLRPRHLLLSMVRSKRYISRMINSYEYTVNNNATRSHRATHAIICPKDAAGVFLTLRIVARSIQKLFPQLTVAAMRRGIS